MKIRKVALGKIHRIRFIGEREIEVSCSRNGGLFYVDRFSLQASRIQGNFKTLELHAASENALIKFLHERN